jgi:pimeloyl-ACP methyl ester carboxylesterase
VVVRRRARHTAAQFTDDPTIQTLLTKSYLDHASVEHVRSSRHELRGTSMGVGWIRSAKSKYALPDVPVLVLSGSRGLPGQLRNRWTELHRQIADQAQQGVHFCVQDAGHMIHHDQPDMVTDALLHIARHAHH